MSARSKEKQDRSEQHESEESRERVFRLPAAPRFARKSYRTRDPGTEAGGGFYTVLEQVRVSQVLLHYLRLEGVDTVFGIPGKGVSILSRDLAFAGQGAMPGVGKIEFVISRHDGGGAFMADGYARVSGKLGVCVVTSGPGATNAVTGLMCAHVDCSSVLLLSGEVTEEYFGKGGFQEGADAGVNMPGLFSNLTAYSVMIPSADSFQTLFTQSIRTATSLPRRAVAVSLPLNVSGAELPEVHLPRSRENYVVTANGLDVAAVRRASEHLHKARRPLLFLGSGAREALIDPRDPEGSRARREAFIEHVVDKHCLPVMTSPRAKGIFPESHPCSLRNFGLAACLWSEQYLLQGFSGDGPEEEQGALKDRHVAFPGEPHYDALLVIGTALKQWTTNGWDPALVPAGAFMQADLDATAIARNFPVEVGIVANARAVIDALIQWGRETPPSMEVEPRRRFLARLKQLPAWVDGKKRDSLATPVLPQRVMAELQHVLDHALLNDRPLREAGAHIFLDTGNVLGWAWHELVIDPPTQLWCNTGMGAMGWGICAAIGGKKAAPGNPCLVLTGDGAFLMNGTEIATAAAHGLGITWIVFQDEQLGMVSQGMASDFAEAPPGKTWTECYALGHSDLETFARGLGADTYSLSEPGMLRAWLPAILQRAETEGKPQVVIVHIDPEEKPPYQYLGRAPDSDP